MLLFIYILCGVVVTTTVSIGIIAFVMARIDEAKDINKDINNKD